LQICHFRGRPGRSATCQLNNLLLSRRRSQSMPADCCPNVLQDTTMECTGSNRKHEHQAGLTLLYIDHGPLHAQPCGRRPSLVSRHTPQACAHAVKAEPNSIGRIWSETHISLQAQKKKTFTPFGVPGCKPEATLVPETGVAAAQHIHFPGKACTCLTRRQLIYQVPKNRELNCRQTTGWVVLWGHLQAQTDSVF